MIEVKFEVSGIDNYAISSEEISDIVSKIERAIILTLEETNLDDNHFSLNEDYQNDHQHIDKYRQCRPKGVPGCPRYIHFDIEPTL
ncbi:hypothetical protein [Nodosilinea nodulosa]|uniref:hypothetical protein n=1 Tax=Nodosilinea nodulosa TaxID=416001 RepID=UPI0012D74F8B|nr:hypothetical protein [Nodosilinea nodulosa]